MMISLRPYQERPVASLSGCPRGVVKAPAGSGKTVIGAAAIDQWLRSFRSISSMAGDLVPITWIANTQEQVEQGRAAVAAFPGIALRARVRFGCYAAQLDCSGEMLVVLDECHHIASPEFRKCLDGCTGWRWGLSATPDRSDELKQDVFNLIGPIISVVDRTELVRDGNLARAVVYFHEPNAVKELEGKIARLAEPLISQRLRFWRVSEDEIRKRTLWVLCQQHGIFENSRRNDMVVALGQAHSDDSVLILVGSIEHGEALAARLPDAVVAHSGMGKIKRRDAIAGFRDGSLKRLISTSLADEGLDVPRANVLILAAGGRSAAKAEQRTGRVLRAWGEKTHGVIHDFMDVQHPFLYYQSIARKKVYEGLGYQIKTSFVVPERAKAGCS